jgi:hypothetical protein
MSLRDRRTLSLAAAANLLTSQVFGAIDGEQLAT